MNISVREFDYIREMVHGAAAIELIDEKKYLVELRLGILAYQEGFHSAGKLIAQLKAGADKGLRKKVVEAMTTNETLFFRDQVPFELMRKQLIPKLLKQRESQRELRIWSAACSTGQEPYSLAMLLQQHFAAEIASWDVRIQATDLSAACLDYAARACYNQIEINRGLPAPMLVRFFSQVESGWQLSPEIQRMVSFQELNLIEQWPPLPRMDIIFLRNVLIYFSLETRKKILEKVRLQLKPDGYLLLGRSETTHNIVPYFRRAEEAAHDNCYQLC